MTTILSFVRGPWAIAVYTWREGMRKKTLVGFLILSLMVIFGSNFITAFMFESGGIEGPGSDVETKLIKDICITAIAIFGILITIFISASVVPTEIENKVVYTILSKPVRRLQYLLGKFVGVQLIVILNLVLMGLLFFLALYFKERVWPTLLLWSLLIAYFEFLIVSAFTFAVSCTASSAVLPTIAGLFIYITGYLSEYLKDTAERAGQTTQVLDALIGKMAYGLYLVLPNLRAFSRIEKQIVYAQPNDPVQAELIPQLILLSLVYCFAGYIMAYWIFRRREL